MKLLHDFRVDPAAQRLFQAKWGDKFIAWSDFCFDASTDAERLVRAVATGADYPLAVHGMVGREAGSALKPGSWVLSLDAGRSSVPVRLRARERAYIDYPRGSRILAYGLWGDGQQANPTARSASGATPQGASTRSASPEPHQEEEAAEARWALA